MGKAKACRKLSTRVERDPEGVSFPDSAAAVSREIVCVGGVACHKMSWARMEGKAHGF